MLKKNNKGFMLLETLLVSVFIASTLIFLYIQFQKVRDSYQATFSYNTVIGTYASSNFLKYLQENGIENLSKTINSGTVYIDLTTCPTGYLTNTAMCKKLVTELGIKKVIYSSSDTGPLVTRMSAVTDISPKFKSFIKTIKVNNRISYRLLFEYNDETYATILARSATPPAKSYAVGEVVYFDPTGAVSGCAAGKEWTTSNTGTTCYKWNVIKDNGNTIEMLLDHNLIFGDSSTSYWITSADYTSAGGSDYGRWGNNKYGPITLYNTLKTLTSSWNKAESFTSSDNVTRQNGSGGTYTLNYSGMYSRLISGQEVADVAKLSGWTPSSDSSFYSLPNWLYSNISSTSGYWTDTALASNSGSSWSVNDDASVSGRLVQNYSGLRPVIRAQKSKVTPAA